MDDQEDLYDEFGNYIGPDLDSSDDESSSDDDESSVGGSAADGPVEGDAVPDEAASDVSVDPGGGGAGAPPSSARGAIVPRTIGGGDPEHEGAGAAASAIVLHEDKVHYPSAEEVYGPEVKTAVLDEDAMDLEVPIIAPIKTNNFSLIRDDDDDGVTGMGVSGSSDQGGVEGGRQDEMVSEEYLTALLSNETTRTRRGLALIGHLHHGKTTFVDLLVEQTKVAPDAFGPRASMEAHSGAGDGSGSGGGGPRITDNLRSEQDRQLSVKSSPITLCLPDTRGKSYGLTVIDCPGHTAFHDETCAALRCADGAVLAVDAVEGVMMHTTMAVAQAVSEGLPICLLITKVDRLIVELKLPPDDAYYKLRRIVDEVNLLVRQKSRGRYPELSPARGNVAFAAAMHGWSFTLGSMAAQYVDHCTDVAESGGDDYGGDDYGDDYGYGGNGVAGVLGRNLPADELVPRLWGNCYLDPATGTFRKRAADCDGAVKRTFVAYVLEPIYKIYAACLGESEKDTERLLRGVGVLLSRDQLRASARPLLRAALRRFFGPSTGFVDMVVGHL